MGGAAGEFAKQATEWPTPTGWEQAENPETWAARRAAEKERGLAGNGFGVPLDMAATMWRSPDAPGQGGPRNRQDSAGDGHQLTIAEQAEHWPTPGANDHKGSAQMGQQRRQLSEATEQKWPTPTGQDSEASGSRLPSAEAHPGTSLTDATSRSFPPDREPAPSGTPSSSATPVSRRRLNHRFVSWLMGWPLLARRGCASLGNGVVPLQAAYAFCALWAGREVG